MQLTARRCWLIIISYPEARFVPTSVSIAASSQIMQANKTADNQYLIPLIDGTIENIDITDGILLTTSEFVSQEDIEMTTTHDDLSLFQISFCIDGNMEWSYINNEIVHQFQIAA